MTRLERITKAIDWLIYIDSYSSRREIAEKLGYKESYFSQVLNSKVPLADKFIKNLSILNDNINLNWLLTGEGEMLNTQEKEQPFIEEVIPVPEDAYMMAEYADLETAAGYIGGGDVDTLPEKKKRLVPREYEKGIYLVIRVSGNSMNDGTIKSLCDGDEILIRELSPEERESLPIRKRLFVITTRDGNVVKQITEVNKEEGYIRCHSFNPAYPDYDIQMEDIFQIFVVYKVVQKQIVLD